MQRGKFKSPTGVIRLIAAPVLAVALLCGLSAGAAALELVPVGKTVGISLSAGGLMVSGLTEIETENGKVCPAAAAGVQPGDLITAVNGNSVDSAEGFISSVAKAGDCVRLSVTRGQEQLELKVYPVDCGEGVKKLGLWLRDGISGIGTVTFIDPETGFYGALGHAVSDIDSGVLVPVEKGCVMHSQIIDVRRGERGVPGELCGCYDDSAVLGSIDKNTPCGIFGTITADALGGEEALPVAEPGELHLGNAEILANVCGEEVECFDIEITQIYTGDRTGRSMMIEITDPELLDITGGIVQGMSGSPILQNGRIVGAVTHVLVNDPTKGYGIFIQNMLDAAE